jgi:TRAP-type C4-dicarboxylate transport system permease small subunit
LQEAIMVEERQRPKTDIKVQAVDFITITLFLCMVIAALLQILFRFVLRISVPWTEELARIFYVWVIFLGLVLVEADDNQIKTTFFIHKFPIKYRFAIQVCINIFCILFEMCLTVGAVIMLRQARTMNFGTMPFLPVSILYVPVVLSCPLVIWCLIRQLIHYTGGKAESDGMEEILKEQKEGTQ